MPRALQVSIAGFFFALLCFWMKPQVPRALSGVNDFMGIYAGARLVGTPDQFNADAYLREQYAATGWTAPSILYTRLPAFAMLMRPMGYLRYRTAYFAWETLSLVAILAFLIVWPAPDRPLLLCAAWCSFPLYADLFGGQDVAFLLLILAIAWHWAGSKPFLAGTFLGLLALKFHLFLLLPVFLISQRRWKMLRGVAAMLVLVAIACFAAAGPGWIPQYLHFILQGQTNPGAEIMVNLHALVAPLPHSAIFEALACLAVAAAVAWIARRTSFAVGLSIALAGSLLTSHHAYAADALLLLPAMLTLMAELTSLPVRILGAILLTPLPFMLTLAEPRLAPVPWLSILLLLLVSAAVAKGARIPAGSMQLQS